jgi:uncharacterized protein with NRDE domain
LCRDVLDHATPTSAVDWVLRALSQHAYAGFNLVIATAEAACVIEAADSTCVTQLVPGINSISNGPLTAHDDRRVNLAQTLVTQMFDEERDWRAYLHKSQEICALHSTHAALGMCVHRDHWGTVASTIAALASDPKQSEYLYAPGPPCRTAYVDYSEAFRGMVASNR